MNLKSLALSVIVVLATMTPLPAIASPLGQAACKEAGMDFLYMAPEFRIVCLENYMGEEIVTVFQMLDTINGPRATKTVAMYSGRGAGEIEIMIIPDPYSMKLFNAITDYNGTYLRASDAAPHTYQLFRNILVSDDEWASILNTAKRAYFSVMYR